MTAMLLVCLLGVIFCLISQAPSPWCLMSKKPLEGKNYLEHGTHLNEFPLSPELFPVLVISRPLKNLKISPFILKPPVFCGFFFVIVVFRFLVWGGWVFLWEIQVTIHKSATITSRVESGEVFTFQFTSDTVGPCGSHLENSSNSAGLESPEPCRKLKFPQPPKS